MMDEIENGQKFLGDVETKGCESCQMRMLAAQMGARKRCPKNCPWRVPAKPRTTTMKPSQGPLAATP